MGQAEDIRQALADRLNTIPNFGVSPYVMTNPNPPCAYIDSGEIEYDEAMDRGLDMLTFQIVVLVGATADIASQKRLDEFREPTGAVSIKALIEEPDADGFRTLGGVVDDVLVTKVSKPQVYALQTLHTSSTSPYLGCEFTVEIHATPS